MFRVFDSAPSAFRVPVRVFAAHSVTPWSASPDRQRGWRSWCGMSAGVLLLGAALCPAATSETRSALVTPPAAISIPAASDSTTSASPRVADVVGRALQVFSRDPAYAGATVAFALVDARTGEILAERDATRSVTPASVMKSLTTAAVLHGMSPSVRFETRLEAAGPTTSDGTLRGDLIVRGGGDPTFGATRVNGSLSSVTVLERFSAAVKAAGIRIIEGAVIGDDSALGYDPVPDAWEWADFGNGYGAGPSGLSFADNIFVVTFSTSGKVGGPAPITRVTPVLPDIAWSNLMRVGPPGSGDQGNVYGAPGTARRWARGTVPKDGPEFSIKGSLPDPAVLVARLLHEKLLAAGVRIGAAPMSSEGCPAECLRDTGRGEWRTEELCEGRTSGSAVLLDRISSPELGAIIHRLNKESNNLYAETLLQHLGGDAWTAGKRSDETSTGGVPLSRREVGLRRLRRFLEEVLHVPTHGFFLQDGSGISRSNGVTARGMALFFRAMQSEQHFETWRTSLPHLGVDGDVSRRGKGTSLAGRVRAKTGLLGNPPTRSLCGYLEAKSGQTYCFALLSNFHTNSSKEVDRDTDAALLTLYEGL